MSPKDLAVLERRRDLLNLLIAVRRQHGAPLERLLSAAMVIIVPNIRAGRAPPIGEILLDARFGGEIGEWGPVPRDHLRGRHAPGYRPDVTTHRAYQALLTLSNFPMRLYGPLLAGCICTLELEFGPLTMVEPNTVDDVGLPDGEVHLRLLKCDLHYAADRKRRPRNFGDNNEAQFIAWWNRIGWRNRMQELAANSGYATPPERMVRLFEWLPESLKACLTT